MLLGPNKNDVPFHLVKWQGGGFFTEEDINRHVQRCSNKVVDKSADLVNRKKTEDTRGLCQDESCNRKFTTVYEKQKIRRLKAINDRSESFAAVMNGENVVYGNATPLDVAFGSFTENEVEHSIFK